MNSGKLPDSCARAPMYTIFVLKTPPNATAPLLRQKTRLPTLRMVTVTNHEFARSLEDANDHDSASECHYGAGYICHCAFLRQFDVAEGWENECERASRCCAKQLKNNANVASEKGERESRNDKRTSKDNMTVGVVVFIREPVIVHYFSADEGFEWKCGKHVEAEE